MNQSTIDRRTFLASASPLLLAGPDALRSTASASGSTTGSALAGQALGQAGEGGRPGVSASFPSQDQTLVKEMVGVSHGNLARVRELLERQPTLAKAAYDWGYGDWETALGAASHVGNRPIAELLLANGARPTLFSAAMLGQLDVVKAFVTAWPGAQKIKGPHGITLLSHARAGGEAAKPVLAYLESIGDADLRTTSQPLTDAEIASIVGAYSFGPGSTDHFDVTYDKNALFLTRRGGTGRGLTHLGSLAFFPVGAEAVRIRFARDASGTTLTIHDPDVVVEARKA